MIIQFFLNNFSNLLKQILAYFHAHCDMSVCARMCVYIWVCMCVDAYVYMDMYVCMDVYGCVHVHACVCACAT